MSCVQQNAQVGQKRGRDDLVLEQPRSHYCLPVTFAQQENGDWRVILTKSELETIRCHLHAICGSSSPNPESFHTLISSSLFSGGFFPLISEHVIKNHTNPPCLYVVDYYKSATIKLVPRQPSDVPIESLPLPHVCCQGRVFERSLIEGNFAKVCRLDTKDMEIAFGL